MSSDSSSSSSASRGNNKKSRKRVSFNDNGHSPVAQQALSLIRAALGTAPASISSTATSINDSANDNFKRPRLNLTRCSSQSRASLSVRFPSSASSGSGFLTTNEVDILSSDMCQKLFVDSILKYKNLLTFYYHLDAGYQKLLKQESENKAPRNLTSRLLSLFL